MRASARPRESGRAGWFPYAAVTAFVLAAAFLAGALTGCGEQAGGGPYARLLPEPDEVEHVTGAGEVTEYRDDTLYDFLNGGAELYFDYDIVAAISREYQLPEDSGIEISVYDMGEPRNAFGIYSIFRYAGADREEIGAEAIRTPATLDFWKGRYYCKLFAFGSSEVAESAMATLARAVAGRITGTGSEPGLLRLLPGANRAAGSEKYFRRYLALNNIRYIDSENVFGLSEATEGVAAEYRTGERAYTGYIIRYPDSAQARTAFEGYTSFLGTEAQESSRSGVKVFIVDGGTTEAIALEGDHIVGVWDADATDLGFVESVLASLAGED